MDDPETIEFLLKKKKKRKTKKLKNINRQKGPSTKFQEFHMGS